MCGGGETPLSRSTATFPQMKKFGGKKKRMNVMIDIVENVFKDDGVKFMKILSSGNENINLKNYVPFYLIKHAPKMIHVEQILDFKLMKIITEISWPVLGPVDIERLGTRRYFFVHRYYGSRISECVRIGADGWNFGRGVNADGVRQKAELAFVRKLPAGIENGVDVYGCRLFEAEWMMPGCVAVGV